MKNSNVKGLFALTISSGLFMLGGYVVNVVLARTLGPSEFGTFSIVISLVTILNLIQTAGLPQAVSKYIAENQHHARSILKSGIRIQIISSLILCIILIVLSPAFSLLLKDVNLAQYLILASLTFPFYGLFSLYGGYHNGMHNFTTQAIANSIYVISKTIFILTLSYYIGLNGAILGFALASLLALPYTYRNANSNKVFSPKKLINYSKPLIIFSILSTALLSIDILIVKSYLSNIQVGFYAAAQSIAATLFYGLNAFSTVLLPNVSRLITESRQKAITFINNALKLIIIILIPLVLIIYLFSGNLIGLLYSSVYMTAVAPLKILILGYGLLTLFTIITSVFNGSANVKISFLLSGLAVILDVVLCFILVPRLGLIGAALSTTISIGIALVISLVYLYRLFGVAIHVKIFIILVAYSLTWMILLHLFNTDNVLLKLLQAIIFIACYIYILFFTHALDIKQLKKMTLSFMSKKRI